jgi:hypothetical protein
MVDRLRSAETDRMTFPIVTEITPRPEAVTHDPFIDGLGAANQAAAGVGYGAVGSIAAARLND